jgi:hypothetical protein
MANKDLNNIAAIEKAISEKYGTETIQNPNANWDENKEKEYLNQMREFYKKKKKNETQKDRVDIGGIKVSKKFLNRDKLKGCPVCGAFPKIAKDDVCFIKYDCCYACYERYVIGREQRWFEGWRPNHERNKKN